MATANDVLRIAAGEIGYSRWTDPEAGTKYGRWYAAKTGSGYFGTSGVPYCAMFVSWVLDRAGQACAGFPGAACTYILDAARRAGLVLADKRSAQPGDLVIYDWPATQGGCDHIGIVELARPGYVQAIEGNTSPGSSGSQGNGGGVYRRTRDWSLVQAVIRPKYSGSAPAPAPSGIAEDGWWGEDTTRALQKLFGTPVDGVVSSQDGGRRGVSAACTSGWEWVANPQGSQLMVKMQRWLGVAADGIAGPATWNALIKKMMAKGSGADLLDGRLDGPSITVKCMQRHVNAGTLLK